MTVQLAKAVSMDMVESVAKVQESVTVALARAEKVRALPAACFDKRRRRGGNCLSVIWLVGLGAWARAGMGGGFRLPRHTRL